MVALGIVCVAFATGCGSNDATNTTGSTNTTTTAAAAGAEPMTISSAVGMDVSSAFGRVYAKGVEDAAKRYGVKITNLGLTEAYTEQKAVDYLNSAIASRPDGLITAVYDPKAWETPLKKAADLGIPVVVVNASDARPIGERSPYLFYIGEDSTLVGQRAAEEVLAAGKPRRAVCEIQFAGSASLEQRCAGFMDTLGKAGVEVEKISISPSDPTQASQTVSAYLSRHPDTDAIFVQSPLGGAADADGTAAAVVESAHQPKLVYNGPSEQTLKAIADGKALGTVDQQVYLQGYLAVEWLYLHHTYGFLPAADIPTGPFFVDKGNVAAFRAGLEEGVRG